MEPIYNRHDRVVDTNIDRLNAGHGDYVYCQRAQHLGGFKGYLFCDYRGGVVVFKAGAKGGPGLPTSAISPILPFPAIPPIQLIPSIPPIPMLASLGWAALDWRQLISA